MTQFLPERTLEGGTLVGTSYTNEFAGCPYSWFNSYLRPHPTAPHSHTGIRGRFTSPFLLAGRTGHVGWATWYESGVHEGRDTGRRDIELAVTAARASHDKALHEYESAERADEDWNTVEVMLRSYHDWYGPGGAHEEFPELEVAVDGNGEALVEREFPLPLGYQDYVFTTRPDLICTLRGMYETWDHKTSHYRFVGERKEWTHWDPQFKGEQLALHELFPDLLINKSRANIIVKNRSPKSKWNVREQESVRCTERDLWAYKVELVDVLQQIDQRVENYFQAVGDEAHEPDFIERLASACFPRHGTRTMKCTQYGGCQFQALCLHKDRIEEGLAHFKPRELEERDAARERPY